MKTKYTRQELYTLVWSIPISTINKELSIPDNSLRTICKKMDIPVPKSGHWQKVEWNKEYSIDKLSPSLPLDQKVKLYKISNGLGYTFNQLNSLSITIHEIENDSRLNLVVPERLSKPHQLIKSYKEDIKNKKAKWDHWNLDLNVSNENSKRAMLLMDTILKMIEARGHSIEISDSDTFVIVFGMKMRIRLREKSNRVITETYGSYNYTSLVFNNKLTFEIYEHNWHHDPVVVNEGVKKMEELLSRIMAKIEIKTQMAKKKKIELEKIWAEQARKRKIQEDLQAKVDAEIVNTKKLFKASQRWNESIQLTNFINEVKHNTSEIEQEKEAFKEWILWAKQKADWINPLIDLDVNLLRGVDKEEFLQPPIKKETKWFGY